MRAMLMRFGTLGFTDSRSKVIIILEFCRIRSIRLIKYLKVKWTVVKSDVYLVYYCY